MPALIHGLITHSRLQRPFPSVPGVLLHLEQAQEAPGARKAAMQSTAAAGKEERWERVNGDGSWGAELGVFQWDERRVMD